MIDFVCSFSCFEIAVNKEICATSIKKNIKAGCVYIEESFDTNVNMDYVGGAYNALPINRPWVRGLQDWFEFMKVK